MHRERGRRAREPERRADTGGGAELRCRSGGTTDSGEERQVSARWGLFGRDRSRRALVGRRGGRPRRFAAGRRRSGRFHRRLRSFAFELVAVALDGHRDDEGDALQQLHTRGVIERANRRFPGRRRCGQRRHVTRAGDRDLDEEARPGRGARRARKARRDEALELGLRRAMRRRAELEGQRFGQCNIRENKAREREQYGGDDGASSHRRDHSADRPLTEARAECP